MCKVGRLTEMMRGKCQEALCKGPSLLLQPFQPRLPDFSAPGRPCSPQFPPLVLRQWASSGPRLGRVALGCRGSQCQLKWGCQAWREGTWGWVSVFPRHCLPLAISLSVNTGFPVPPGGGWLQTHPSPTLWLLCLLAFLGLSWGDPGLSPFVDGGLSWEGTMCPASNQAPHGLGATSPFRPGSPMVDV